MPGNQRLRYRGPRCSTSAEQASSFATRSNPSLRHRQLKTSSSTSGSLNPLWKRQGSRQRVFLPLTRSQGDPVARFLMSGYGCLRRTRAPEVSAYNRRTPRCYQRPNLAPLAYATRFALFYSFCDGVLLRSSEYNTGPCVLSRKKLNGQIFCVSGMNLHYSKII